MKRILCAGILLASVQLGAESAPVREKIGSLFIVNRNIISEFRNDNDRSRGWRRCEGGAKFTQEAKDQIKRLLENEIKLSKTLARLKAANEPLWQQRGMTSTGAGLASLADAQAFVQKSIEILLDFQENDDNKRRWKRCEAPATFTRTAKTMINTVESNDAEVERFLRRYAMLVEKHASISDF